MQHFDGEQRDQAHQRTHPELVEVAVGVAQNVVEEAVVLEIELQYRQSREYGDRFILSQPKLYIKPAHFPVFFP